MNHHTTKYNKMITILEKAFEEAKLIEKSENGV